MGAVRRVQMELLKSRDEPLEACFSSVISASEPFKWEGVIIGPTDTPYEDGIFRFEITLP